VVVRAQTPKPELAAILERAGQHVVAYGQELTNLLAEEECVQTYAPGDPVHQVVRDIRAGVLVAAPAGGFAEALVQATTRYKGYLRFSVSTDETVTVPPKP
jgi:hypothetical protein